MHAVLRRQLRHRRSPRNAARAIFALNFAVSRFRFPVIGPSFLQGEPSLASCPKLPDHFTNLLMDQR